MSSMILDSLMAVQAAAQAEREVKEMAEALALEKARKGWITFLYEYGLEEQITALAESLPGLRRQDLKVDSQGRIEVSEGVYLFFTLPHPNGRPIVWDGRTDTAVDILNTQARLDREEALEWYLMLETELVPGGHIDRRREVWFGLDGLGKDALASLGTDVQNMIDRRKWAIQEEASHRQETEPAYQNRMRSGWEWCCPADLVEADERGQGYEIQGLNDNGILVKWTPPEN